ncbi:AfsR/SARP family transcriptional regulator [Plantactinospora soyae]|uniref:Two-component SAPR family response regulator n=1 Tax=Plantactinospora soyae TaxID=1544732 RepID=A0A927M7D2_9ACTN|nr:BTAD domain-containing putative transcriptional regulator [Plantactinospora soyae]MBE1489513.1 two-component SAPR family response regulator [Plantactinospora soyae]
MSTTTAMISVRCLGPFTATLGKREIGPWRAGKARGLFQFLLVNRGRPVPRDKLHDVLWPQAPWSPGSSSLKVAVHGVRQILAGTGADSASTAEIRFDDRGYRFQADDIWVDVEEFESAMDLAAVRAAGGDRDGALRLYRRAAELHQGDFLEGEAADWVVEHRGWIQAKALRGLTSLRDDAHARSDLAEVILWCRRILRIDPYHEATYRMLMLTHGQLGELGQVRSWHAICVRRLREDLAVEPQPETDLVLRRFLGARRRGAPAEIQPLGNWRHRVRVPAC